MNRDVIVKKKGKHQIYVHPSTAIVAFRGLKIKTRTHCCYFPQSVRSESISWKLSPSYTDVASRDAHWPPGCSHAQRRASVWRQRGWRHRGGGLLVGGRTPPPSSSQPSSRSFTGHQLITGQFYSYTKVLWVYKVHDRHTRDNDQIIMNIIGKCIKYTDFHLL